MMAIDEMIEVLKAAKEGKQIQATGGVSGWYDLLSPSWDFSSYSYRVKPAKKLRPWKPDEVPVGAVIKSKKTKNSSLILGVNFSEENSICCFSDWFSPSDLLRESEYSADNGKTWLPCGVEE